MKNNNCEKCGNEYKPDLIKCPVCEGQPDNKKNMWKPANMGKQRIKPVNNRDGKKNSIRTKLHHR